MLQVQSKLTNHKMPPSMIRTTAHLRPSLKKPREAEVSFHELLNMAGLAH